MEQNEHTGIINRIVMNVGKGNSWNNRFFFLYILVLCCILTIIIGENYGSINVGKPGKKTKEIL